MEIAVHEVNQLNKEFRACAATNRYTVVSPFEAARVGLSPGCWEQGEERMFVPGGEPHAIGGKDGFCVTKNDKIVCNGSSREVFMGYLSEEGFAIQKNGKWCRIDDTDRLVCDGDRLETVFREDGWINPNNNKYCGIQENEIVCNADEPLHDSFGFFSGFQNRTLVSHYQMDGHPLTHIYKNGKPCGCSGEECEIQCADGMDPAMFLVEENHVKIGDKYCDWGASKIHCNSDEPVETYFGFSEEGQSEEGQTAHV